jgi:retron-type reverse transcriptase
VPTVVDRLIQQALLQVLQKRWDPTFSEHSYGFRPGRSAHQTAFAPFEQLVLNDLDKELERRGHRFAATPTTVRHDGAKRR